MEETIGKPSNGKVCQQSPEAKKEMGDVEWTLLPEEAFMLDFYFYERVSFSCFKPRNLEYFIMEA